MQLIIESGASKSNWVVLDNNGHVRDRIKLKGINPTSNPSSIELISRPITGYSEVITQIYFYGAGVTDHRIVDILHNTFRDNYPKLLHFKAESDMLAAARAVSAGSPGIICILGTGSNACFFDGEIIIHKVPSPGYIFGDPGSGFSIGKEILERYFWNTLDDRDRVAFEDTYVKGHPPLLYSIYAHERPNYFIAGFSQFLDASSATLKQDVLTKVFRIFFEKQIGGFEQSRKYPLKFVGSIASVFSEELKAVAHDHGYTIKDIVSDPIQGLIKYHKERNGR